MTGSTSLIMEEVTDPVELASGKERRERFDRNVGWLQARAQEVYSQHRGLHICVAGEELFVAGTAAEALAQARDAHPEDDGLFLRYIPREKVARIYADLR